MNRAVSRLMHGIKWHVIMRPMTPVPLQKPQRLLQDGLRSDRVLDDSDYTQVLLRRLLLERVVDKENILLLSATESAR